MADNKVVDLNELLPQGVTIKFGSPARDIDIPPPRTGQLLRLGALGQKMQTVDAQNPEAADQLDDEMAALLYEIIPGLNGEPLHTAQKLKLFEILTEMAMPEQMDELKKRGITLDPKAPPKLG
ncbi:MAG: hypothetical protein WC822_07395 [Candidatus Paceibacterota bacterium]|jgi:hypothetical protein